MSNKFKLKYNYVIVGAGKYYLIGYRDIMQLDNVSFHETHKDGFNTWLEKKLLRLNFSHFVNSIIKTPFARYVYPKLFPHHFVDDKPLCFLFFSNSNPAVLNSSYFDYLRSKHKGIKLVMFYQDIVSSKPLLDINRIKSKMDLVVSYDKGDCEKYDLLYHPTPFSYVEVEENKNLKNSDFYFCGYAKTRFPLVHRIYQQLSNQGYRCDFNLLGLPENIAHIEGIHYIEEPFTYMENLQHVVKSSCVLEIMQEGADGFTPRLWECITYGRHLLTNNKSIWDSPFFTEENIHSVSDIINGEIPLWLTNKAAYSPEMKDSLSPLHLLQFIESNLNDYSVTVR